MAEPESLYRHVAATMASVEWGSVATTVPEDNVPSVLPLRQAYELRPHVRAAERAAGATVARRHMLLATALVQALEQTARAIDAAVAAQLSCEVLFGMAKTAPMTDAALAEGTS